MSKREQYEKDMLDKGGLIYATAGFYRPLKKKYFIEYGIKTIWSGNILLPKSKPSNRFGRFRYRDCPFIKIKYRWV